VVAGATGLGGGLVVDQQVEVRSVRPPAPPVLQPVQQQFHGEVVERADAAGDGQPTVADVEVVEHEGAYLGDPGGVNCGEGEDQARGGSGGGCDGSIDLAGRERLEHAVLVLADLDTTGGFAEDQAGLLGPGEQRAQGAELVPAVVAVQGLEVGEDVLAGHLPQMVVAVRPAQQCRAGPVEVEPDRALLPGQAAGAAVLPRGVRRDGARTSQFGRREGGLTTHEPHPASGRDGAHRAPGRPCTCISPQEAGRLSLDHQRSTRHREFRRPAQDQE